jgi:hypothetical protein
MNIQDFIKEKKMNSNPTPDSFIRSFRNELKKIHDDFILELDKIKKDGVDKNAIKVLKEIDIEFNKKEKELVANVNDYFPEFKSIMDAELSKTLSETKDRIQEIISVANRKIEDATYRIENARGPKGERGDDGLRGNDGKNGSPDKPDEVVDKVNSAKKKIAMSSIFGLFEELSKIRQAINNKSGGGGSKSGGGMGNTVHEVKDISSATTTISLLSHIAGNGTAIFGARYQGQVLDLGVHYTVSGKTITLLFTPEDATKFSISYVRT